MTITIRPIAETDFFAWLTLFEGYNTFYEQTLTDEKAVKVWSWLTDPDAEVRGLVAENEHGALVGLAHYRVFLRPLAGGSGLYLDDLFVSEDARGNGTATALLERLKQEARENGHTVVRWLTASDNEKAQNVYNSVAERTQWVTYDMQP